LPDIVPISAPANAPIRSWPSIATFTTPDRSQSTPASEPKISGRASRKVPRTVFTSGMKFCPSGAAEICQHRNDSTKATTPTPSSQVNQR
jgi:hypothetical protein